MNLLRFPNGVALQQKFSLTNEQSAAISDRLQEYKNAVSDATSDLKPDGSNDFEHIQSQAELLRQALFDDLRNQLTDELRNEWDDFFGNYQDVSSWMRE